MHIMTMIATKSKLGSRYLRRSYGESDAITLNTTPIRQEAGAPRIVAFVSYVSDGAALASFLQHALGSCRRAI
jgi:hypothetical protein